MELHWQTISNRYALEINQDYAGFSGSRFAQSEQTETFSPWCDQASGRVFRAPLTRDSVA